MEDKRYELEDLASRPDPVSLAAMDGSAVQDVVIPSPEMNKSEDR
jgi:hypothetical protein